MTRMTALKIAVLLDMPGRVGDQTVRALIRFASSCGSSCRRAIVEHCAARIDASLDDDEIRNAHRVLAALGDAVSQRALAADCWADAEEEELLRAA